MGYNYEIKCWGYDKEQNCYDWVNEAHADTWKEASALVETFSKLYNCVKLEIRTDKKGLI